jgi:hypothetical protein
MAAVSGRKRFVGTSSLLSHESVIGIVLAALSMQIVFDNASPDIGDIQLVSSEQES